MNRTLKDEFGNISTNVGAFYRNLVEEFNESKESLNRTLQSLQKTGQDLEKNAYVEGAQSSLLHVVQKAHLDNALTELQKCTDIILWTDTISQQHSVNAVYYEEISYLDSLYNSFSQFTGILLILDNVSFQLHFGTDEILSYVKLK